jgi:hypothetical protein
MWHEIGKLVPVTPPSLTDRLIAHSVLAPINQATADLLQEAALELARLESQLEAVRLAKPAYHQPPYVDGYFGER